MARKLKSKTVKVKTTRIKLENGSYAYIVNQKLDMEKLTAALKTIFK